MLAHGAVDARQVGELLGRRLGDDAFGAGRAAQAQLDLAALEARREHRPEGGSRPRNSSGRRIAMSRSAR
jgi:hypothetical protein